MNYSKSFSVFGLTVTVLYERKAAYSVSLINFKNRLRVRQGRLEAVLRVYPEESK